MRYRPRWGLLTVGWLIVLLLFSFPLWRNVFSRPTSDTPFALADSARREIFLKMENRQIALTAYASSLTVVPIPTETSQTPMPADAQVILSGAFAGLDAVRAGAGRALIYRQADSGLFLQLEDFKITNAPGLAVYLSSNPEPKEIDQLGGTASEFLVSETLAGSTGTQSFVLPRQLRVQNYRSVVIVSEPLRMVYAVAVLR